LIPLHKFELNQIEFFGRQLAQTGGEIGIHGYNHQSLALENQMYHEDYGYNPWESQETMEKSLRILKNELTSLFGDIKFYTYVPPSNIISSEGISAVTNVFEDVVIFAGLYTGSPEKGVLYQEFGMNLDAPNILSFPRFSYGHLYDENMMWSIYSAIAHFGLVNHFIHPDDLLCEERSGGLYWEELLNEITKIFSGINSHFAFLRPMTNIQAYNYFLRQENLFVYSNLEGDEITISYNNVVFPVYHFLRLNNRTVRKIEGGKLNVLCSERGLFLIEGNKPRVIVHLD